MGLPSRFPTAGTAAAFVTELEEADVVLKNHVWEIQINVDAGELEPAWEDPLLQSRTSSRQDDGLLDLYRAWHGQCAIERVRVRRQAGETHVYKYNILHAGDGRVWKQTVTRAEPIVDSSTTFDVPDAWTLRELQTGRGHALQKLIELLNAYTGINYIEVKWL